MAKRRFPVGKWTLLVLLARVNKVHALQDAVVGTTQNGFDNGGNASMCWQSTINASSLASWNSSLIEYSNEQLYQASGVPTDTHLLSECYNGTVLTVQPLNMTGPDRVVFTGQDYTFHIHFESVLSNINPIFAPRSNSSVLEDGKFIMHVRLLMCDAVRQGFCSPLEDLRALDAALQRNDTDWNLGNDTRSFPERGPNEKFMYEQGLALRGISEEKDGKIVVSRWVQWNLKELARGSDFYTLDVNITLRLGDHVRTAAYFFIAHAVLNFPNSTNNGTTFIDRIDVADAVPDNVVEVRSPPIVLQVSDGMKYAVAVASGLFAAWSLGLFVFVVWQRHHAVMKLAQGPFLAAIAFLCLVDNVFVFTVMPTKDLYCQMRGPLVLVPTTMVAAILVARVWRVYSTLAGALALGRQAIRKRRREWCDLGQLTLQMLNFLARAPWWCRNSNGRCGTQQQQRPNVHHRKSSLRNTVSASESWKLVAILSMPQIVLQVVGSAVYRQAVVTDWDAEEQHGRSTCDGESRWIATTGLVVAALVFLLAVVVAWTARDLPSAFNEKDQIFQAASISTMITFVTLALLEITNTPTTSPDVSVFLRAVQAFTVTTAITLLIVFPKVKRVMSGEKVVVSNMLKSRMDTSSTSSDVGNTDEAAAAVVGRAAAFQDRIKLTRDDPLPPSIERQIFALQELLREVSHQCGEGRSLSKDEWRQMQQDVARLKMELDKVELWSESLNGEAEESNGL